MQLVLSPDALSLTFSLEETDREKYRQAGGTLLLEEERGHFAGELTYLAELFGVSVSVSQSPDGEGVTVTVGNARDGVTLFRPFCNLVVEGADLR